MKANCAWCNVLIEIRRYRFISNKSHCCSRKCSAKYRVARGLGLQKMFDASTVDKIQYDYEQTNKTLRLIAEKYKCSRGVICGLAKDNFWIKFKRTQANRTIYRKIASLKIGRPLIKGEHVHHVDGEILNNASNNLHVFPNAKKHTECHGSLERAAFVLYRRGLIKFDEYNGTYYLPRKRSKLNV